MKKFNCVMLVDDDETCNFITEKIITKLNISTHTKSMKNGQEALSFIEENYESSPDNDLSALCPDLILLDINMPVMDGLEFLEEFYNNKILEKKYTDQTSIYVLTSSDNTVDLSKI